MHLVRRTALAEGIAAMPSKPVLYGDNGSTLKAATVLAMLNWLGVKPSYSRPCVSDDNAYAESLFRTAKYRPEFPVKGFTDLGEARTWAAGFVRWYNHDHRHSGIPTSARLSATPVKITRSWLRGTRCTPALVRSTPLAGRAPRYWSPIGPVTLNPGATPSSRCIQPATIFSRWLHERDDNYLDARRSRCHVPRRVPEAALAR